MKVAIAPVDVDDLAALFARPETVRFSSAPDAHDRQVGERELDQALRHWEEHGVGDIASRARGVRGVVPLNLAGVGLEGIDPEAVEIGWYVQPHLWGRGIAAEAAASVLDGEAFGRLGLGTVLARMRPRNTASVRTAEKLGMVHTGRAKARNGDPLLV